MSAKHDSPFPLTLQPVQLDLLLIQTFLAIQLQPTILYPEVAEDLAQTGRQAYLQTFFGIAIVALTLSLTFIAIRTKENT